MSARILDANGYLTIERNPISRAGVFPYLGKSIGADVPDRVYNVFRPPDELASQATIDSFKLQPFVDDHTMLGSEDEGYLPAEKKGTHGTTGENIFFDPTDNVLYANLRVFSETLKNLIQSGKKSLSLGYRCIYEKSSGVFNGIPYDYIQRQMRGNHLALVDAPRCNVAVLDHMAFDHLDVTLETKGLDMADEPENKNADTEAEAPKMTLEQVKEWAKENMPMFRELEAMFADEDADEDEDTTIGEDGNGQASGAAGGATGEDDEPKDKNDKKAGMDAKSVKLGMDAMESRIIARIAESKKSVFKEVAHRDLLAKKLSTVIGTFDASEMTLGECAEYGVKKLGLTNVRKGTESIALDSYFAGIAVNAVKPRAAMDAAVTASKGLNAYINSAKA